MKGKLCVKYPDYLSRYICHRIGGDCILEGEILNLVTKEKYYQKPTIVTMSIALQKMREVCLDHQICKVAMPTIGAGLDKLSWNMVSSQVQKMLLTWTSRF